MEWFWRLLGSLYPESVKRLNRVMRYAWERALRPHGKEAVTKSLLDWYGKSRYFPHVSEIVEGCEKYEKAQVRVDMEQLRATQDMIAWLQAKKERESTAKEAARWTDGETYSD